MPHIVFFHGWAGCSADWYPVIAHLRAETSDMSLSYECPDAGYWGPARLWSGQRPDGVVGHSLGCFDAASLSAAQGCPWISVNGFTRFSRAPDFAAGSSPRALSRMQTQLYADPLITVNAFRNRIKISPLAPQTPCEADALMHGLHRLLTEDHRTHPPQSALAGQCDPLISHNHSRTCFGKNVDFISGGHCLLTTHTQDVAAFVKRAFL